MSRFALLAVGSNIEALRWTRWARDALARRFDVVRCSARVSAEAIGPPGQPPYINGTAVVRTDLARPSLRAVCRHLEWQAGRRRSDDRFAPRTLDLDVVAIMGEGERWVDHDALRDAHVVGPARALVADSAWWGLDLRSHEDAVLRVVSWQIR